MKDFFRKRPMVSFFIVLVAATVVSTWLINPKTGPLALVSGGMTWATAITLFVVFLIFIAGAALPIWRSGWPAIPPDSGSFRPGRATPPGVGSTSYRRLLLSEAPTMCSTISTR
jgi:hypothetical protein